MEIAGILRKNRDGLDTTVIRKKKKGNLGLSSIYEVFGGKGTTKRGRKWVENTETFTPLVYLVIILLLFHWSLNLQWFSLLFNFCFCCCYMFMQIVWNYWLENQFSFLFLNSSCFWSREQSRSHPNVCSVISHNSSFQDHCHLYSFRRFKLCSFHHFREETTFSAAFVENSLFCKHVFVFVCLSPTWPLVLNFFEFRCLFYLLTLPSLSWSQIMPGTYLFVIAQFDLSNWKPFDLSFSAKSSVSSSMFYLGSLT